MKICTAVHPGALAGADPEWSRFQIPCEVIGILGNIRLTFLVSV